MPEPATLPELPTDLESLSRVMQRRMDDGRHALVHIALLVAHCRRQFFPDALSDWLTWTKGYGLDRRNSFRCLRAGALLLEAGYNVRVRGSALLVRNGLETHLAESLFECSVDNLEALSRLPENLLGPFLEKNNPSEMSRDQVRDKVKAYLPRDAVSDADRRARPKRSKSRQPTPLANMIDRFAGITEAEIAAALETLDPIEAVRGSAKLLEAAVHCLQENNTWTAAHFKLAFGELRALDKARKHLEALHAQQETAHGTAHPSRTKPTTS